MSVKKTEEAKMDCNKVHKDLIFYLEGSLDERTTRSVEKHLDKCSDCAAFANMLRESLEVIEKEKNVHEDLHFADRVIAAMQEEKNETITIRLSVLRYIAAAAVIVFGVFTGINIARVVSGYDNDMAYDINNEAFYVNDMYQEPIESFFLLNYDDNE